MPVTYTMADSDAQLTVDYTHQQETEFLPDEYIHELGRILAILALENMIKFNNITDLTFKH